MAMLLDDKGRLNKLFAMPHHETLACIAVSANHFARKIPRTLSKLLRYIMAENMPHGRHSDAHPEMPNAICRLVDRMIVGPICVWLPSKICYAR